MTDSIQKLENTKESSTKNKLSALFRIAFYVASHATAILSITFGLVVSPLAITGIVGATICSNIILSYYNANRINFNFENNYSAPALPLFIGPFMPIYEIFYKVSNLQNEVEQQKKLRSI